MVDFQDILGPGALNSSLVVNNKKQLFQKLGEMAAAAYGLDATTVYDRLMERERLGSTGFGGGIAIPHAKLEGIEHVRGLVVRLENPIDFGAVDEAPVDIVFSLLSPQDSGAEHLKMLARVSRYLRGGGHVSRLRGAASDEAMMALLTDDGTRDAA